LRLKRKHRGFTLVELLVACTLLSVVLGGVYVAFSSSVRLWRSGEANLRTYQDARTAMTIMTRELESIVPGTVHLCQGKEDEFEFYAVAPSFDVEEDALPRLMWVKYRLKQDADVGKTLVREERMVQSSLPPPARPGDMDGTRVGLGRRQTFDLASGVLDFDLRYVWVVQDEEQLDALDDEPSDAPVAVMMAETHDEGTGLPQGIHLSLTLEDPNAADGETTFRTLLSFRGPTRQLAAVDEEPLTGEEPL